MKLQADTIDLGNDTSFKIYHNLRSFGLSIDAALANWLFRTDTYTAESFCEYVKSKDPINIIALTESEAKKKQL